MIDDKKVWMKRSKMENFELNVLTTIKQYQLIEDGDIIVLGVSGGPDSMCMLNLLVDWERRNKQNIENGLKRLFPMVKIVVAHVNHKLRKEANADEEYVRKYCEKNNIEFYTKRIDVEKIAHTNKIGTEEAGRRVRYDFFQEVLANTKATKISVAHNKNDKIETILLHTLRGSGMEGLKGIEPKRGNLIRPLITCEREEIEKYCEEKKLNPRMDKTNSENIYRRNKVRNVILPYIQREFNPNIIQTMERLSMIISQENEYMEKQTQKIYQNLCIEEKQKINLPEIVLDLKIFNLQEMVIKSRLIRYTIRRLLGSTVSIEKIHIDDIIKLCEKNIGNKYLTPNKQIKVLVKNHKIYFTALS